MNALAGALRPWLSSSAERRQPDWTLVAAIAGLVSFGIVMIFSASSVWSYHHHDGDATRYLVRQLAYVALGGLGFAVAYRLDLARLRTLAGPLLIVGFVLMMLVFLPGIGKSLGGARRWIHLPGFTFQPAELMKLLLVLVLADWFATRRTELPSAGPDRLVPPVLVVGAAAGLSLLQPDFGSAVTFGGLAIALAYLAGIRPMQLGVAVGVLAAAAVAAVATSPYRRRRVFAFLNPWGDPSGKGFQIIQSLIALGSGGLTGVGVAAGVQKLFYLPMPHTDFVFAIVGEELGFVGTAGVVAAFLVLLWRGCRTAMRANDTFESLLAAGLTLLLTLQAVVNMAVVTGLVPTKGIALPFLSFGGSSVVVNLLAAGLLANLSSRARP